LKVFDPNLLLLNNYNPPLHLCQFSQGREIMFSKEEVIFSVGKKDRTILVGAKPGTIAQEKV
jgi:hypothetical protein